MPVSDAAARMIEHLAAVGAMNAPDYAIHSQQLARLRASVRDFAVALHRSGQSNDRVVAAARKLAVATCRYASDELFTAVEIWAIEACVVSEDER